MKCTLVSCPTRWSSQPPINRETGYSNVLRKRWTQIVIPAARTVVLTPPQLASQIFDQVSNILILYSDIQTPPQLASIDDIWDIVWPKFQIVISCRHNNSHRWEWANPSRHCLKLFQTYCLCGWFSVKLPVQNNCENLKQFQLKVTSVQQRNTLSAVSL